MITINLLPQELRRKEHKISLPYKGVYVLAGFVVVLLLHLLLFFVTVIKGVQVAHLKKVVSVLEPKTKDAAIMKKEIKDLEARLNMEKAALSRKASITEILTGLNLAVPKGLWVEHFSFSQNGLLIQGSVVSLSQNEMAIIGKFLQDIKNNKTFSSTFSKIELTSVQRRTIKAYDVVDFIVAGELRK